MTNRYRLENFLRGYDTLVRNMHQMEMMHDVIHYNFSFVVYLFAMFLYDAEC